MTIRFAAARSPAANSVVRQICQVRFEHPANDNPANEQSDRLIYEALRHFAQHGLAGARHAKSQAEAAFFAGDRAGYDWWLGICRQLDRRLARECATKMQSERFTEA